MSITSRRDPFSDWKNELREMTADGLSTLASQIGSRAGEVRQAFRAPLRDRRETNDTEELLRESREIDRRFEALLPAVRQRQLIHAQWEQYRLADNRIYSVFFREGGVRFNAENLLLYMDGGVPETAAVRELWIGAYNSCIAYILREIGSLSGLEADLQAGLAGVERSFREDPAAPRSLGYREEIRELRQRLSAMGQDRRAQQPEAYKAVHARFVQTLAANRSALERAEALTAQPPPQPPQALRHGALLRDMRALAEAEPLTVLRSPEGCSREEYLDALNDFTGRVRVLLDRYPFPPGGAGPDAAGEDGDTARQRDIDAAM